MRNEGSERWVFVTKVVHCISKTYSPYADVTIVLMYRMVIQLYMYDNCVRRFIYTRLDACIQSMQVLLSVCSAFILYVCMHLYVCLYVACACVSKLRMLPFGWGC